MGYMEEQVAGRFVPSANDFAAKLFRRIDPLLSPHVGVVYVPSPGNDEQAWGAGLPASLAAALIGDVMTSVAEVEKREEEEAKRRFYLGSSPRTMAVREVVARRVEEATSSGAERWYVGWGAHWLASDVVCLLGLPRDAGESFVSGLMSSLHKNPLFSLGNNVFERLNRIAALRYEGAEGRGTVIFAREDDSTIPIAMRFATPAPLSDAVWSRKLVELATPHVAVLANDRQLFGLAPRAARLDKLHVEFRGSHTWLLRSGTTDVLETRLGIPSLPRPPLTRATFDSALARTLGGDANAARLWDTIAIALQQSHGTLIVISGDAASEAERLRGQGTRVDVVPLSDEVTRSVTSIDGAVLLDRNANCHGIGIILDGEADGVGTPARGARFNSALRYVRSRNNALAVVVSEDGHVDLLPRLTPQIRASELKALLAVVRAATKPFSADVCEICMRLERDYPLYIPEDDREAVLDGAFAPLPLFRDDDEPDPFAVEYDTHPSDVVDDLGVVGG
jgi:hypothetical protein